MNAPPHQNGGPSQGSSFVNGDNQQQSAWNNNVMPQQQQQMQPQVGEVGNNQQQPQFQMPQGNQSGGSFMYVPAQNIQQQNLNSPNMTPQQAPLMMMSNNGGHIMAVPYMQNNTPQFQPAFQAVDPNQNTDPNQQFQYQMTWSNQGYAMAGNHNQIQQGPNNSGAGGINVLQGSGGAWGSQPQQNQLVGVPVMPGAQMNAQAAAWQPGQSFVPMNQQQQQMMMPMVDMNSQQMMVGQQPPPPPSSEQPTPLIAPQGPPKFAIKDPNTGKLIGTEQSGGSQPVNKKTKSKFTNAPLPNQQAKAQEQPEKSKSDDATAMDDRSRVIAAMKAGKFSTGDVAVNGQINAINALSLEVPNQMSDRTQDQMKSSFNPRHVMKLSPDSAKAKHREQEEIFKTKPNSIQEKNMLKAKLTEGMQQWDQKMKATQKGLLGSDPKQGNKKSSVAKAKAGVQPPSLQDESAFPGLGGKVPKSSPTSSRPSPAIGSKWGSKSKLAGDTAEAQPAPSSNHTTPTGGHPSSTLREDVLQASADGAAVAAKGRERERLQQQQQQQQQAAAEGAAENVIAPTSKSGRPAPKGLQQKTNILAEPSSNEAILEQERGSSSSSGLDTEDESSNKKDLHKQQSTSSPGSGKKRQLKSSTSAHQDDDQVFPSGFKPTQFKGLLKKKGESTLNSNAVSAEPTPSQDKSIPRKEESQKSVISNKSRSRSPKKSADRNGAHPTDDHDNLPASSPEPSPKGEKQSAFSKPKKASAFQRGVAGKTKDSAAAPSAEITSEIGSKEASPQMSPSTSPKSKRAESIPKDEVSSNSIAKQNHDNAPIRNGTDAGATASSVRDDPNKNIWSIATFLKIKSQITEVAPEMENITTQKIETKIGDKNRLGGLRRDPRMDKPSFGGKIRGDGKGLRSGRIGQKREEEALKASETGYKVDGPKSRVEELQRQIRQLLNKIAPENFDRILQGFGEIDLDSVADYELAIKLIFEKVLAEPHYCETYADLVYHLRGRFQEPADNTQGARGFRHIILDAAQREFEACPTELAHEEGEDPREYQARYKILKKRAVSNIKFIGHLFLRKLLAAKVVFNVAMGLVKDLDASELKIEMVCVLITNIGFACSETAQHTSMLNSLFARLKEIKKHYTGEAGQRHKNTRIVYMIQDLMDLRDSGWQQKVLKEGAKTLKDVQRDAIHEQRVGPEIKTMVTKRPEYMNTGVAPSQTIKRKDKPAGEKLKKVLGYFIEEKNTDMLFEDFDQLSMSEDDKRLAAAEIIKDAFNGKHQDGSAEFIVHLLKSDRLDWSGVIDGMKNVFDDWDGTKEDCFCQGPNAPRFYAFLLRELAFYRVVVRNRDANNHLKIKYNFWHCLPASDDDAASLLKVALLGNAKEQYFDGMQTALKTTRPKVLASMQ